MNATGYVMRNSAQHILMSIPVVNLVFRTLMNISSSVQTGIFRYLFIELFSFFLLISIFI